MKMLAACLAFIAAVTLWFYILRYGNFQKIRAVDRAAALTQMGDSNEGRHVIETHGCGGCHQIPGIDGAAGHIGAPLDDFRERMTIAGVLPNTADNLIRWLRDPRAIEPLTAMPNLYLSEKEARDAAAYLYSLR